MSETDPSARALQFLLDHRDWVSDLSRRVDEVTLRRALRDGPSLLAEANLAVRARIHGTLGQAHARLGHHRNALDAARNAARLDPTQPRHLVAAAAALLGVGRATSALVALDDAHATAKRIAYRAREVWLLIHAYRAEALDRTGDRAGAREAFEAATRLVDPSATGDAALLAIQAAACGWPHAAIEYVVRWVAAAERFEAEWDRSDVEVIRAAPAEVQARIDELPALAAMVHARLLAEVDGEDLRPSGVRQTPSPHDDASQPQLSTVRARRPPK